MYRKHVLQFAHTPCHTSCIVSLLIAMRLASCKGNLVSSVIYHSHTPTPPYSGLIHRGLSHKEEGAKQGSMTPRISGLASSDTGTIGQYIMITSLLCCARLPPHQSTARGVTVISLPTYWNFPSSKGIFKVLKEFQHRTTSSRLRRNTTVTPEKVYSYPRSRIFEKTFTTRTQCPHWPISASGRVRYFSRPLSAASPSIWPAVTSGAQPQSLSAMCLLSAVSLYWQPSLGWQQPGSSPCREPS